MPILHLIKAGYRYPGAETWVFRHLDMIVMAGESIRLTGRNGSGKSTLLKILSRLLEPTEGQRKSFPGARITYMDQFATEMLALDLTIAEQFKAAAAPESTSLDLAEMIKEFDLPIQERLHDFVGHLSGGERQIVALLCTLADRPSALCLDEFTSAMDVQSTLAARNLLMHAKDAFGLTLILVGHRDLPIETDREVRLSQYMSHQQIIRADKR